MRKVMTAFKLDPDVRVDLDALAERRGVGRSELIRQAIDRLLDEEAVSA